MKRIQPPIFLLGSIVVMLALHFLFPIGYVFSNLWRLVGIVPLLAGVVLNVLADESFKKHRTTVKSFQESTVLVTGDVFGFSRNPMYVGMIFILAGIALLAGSISPWLVVVAMIVVFDRYYISSEERMLEDTFGEAFEEYKQRVKRWI